MKTVIEMAREAEFDELAFDDWTAFTHNIERFAELVRADEREACADLIESAEWSEWFRTDCAKAIRARSNT